MMCEQFLAEAGSVEVNVDFCSLQGFVAEEFLDHAQGGSAFQKMGGEGMAEGMGRDGLEYPGGGS